MYNYGFSIQLSPIALCQEHALTDFVEECNTPTIKLTTTPITDTVLPEFNTIIVVSPVGGVIIISIMIVCISVIVGVQSKRKRQLHTISIESAQLQNEGKL